MMYMDSISANKEILEEYEKMIKTIIPMILDEEILIIIINHLENMKKIEEKYNIVQKEK